MRNKSNPIKENSNVMNTQGGEKKVMKKILSVALSTAMAFSMFASVAFGDTAVSPQQKFDALKAKGIFNGYPDGTAGLEKDMTRAEFAKVITKLLGLKEITGQLSYTDKNYTAKNWAVPYIEAVTAAGIMEGKNVEKKIFDFNGKVTVSEMATILTRALDLEIPAETNNSAPAWAKGYVQAAINAGFLDANANFTGNASRELLVGAAYVIDEAQNLKVASYEVSEAGKVVTFKMSDGESVKVTLDKALVANTDTEVSFKYNDRDFKHTVNWKVEAATKVQSASSVNLKEVDVAFDGKVDKATATDKNNYTVDSNSKGIKSITLLEDGKTARLLLNESSKFTQGTTYKVAVKNVKSSTGTVLPQGEVSFTSSDNTLPTVAEVKALGTKVIKVTFSEPVVAPTSSNFQLDDKAFVGSVTQGANQREVILRDFTGSISEGAHKLTTSLVEDFAGLKSLAATTDFTVVADTEGPKVTEISATLEKVTVTFDEEIDPGSVTNDSFYWKSGDTKKTGKVTQVASNVYEVEFDQANRLPGYESTLFVEVKDYSGNANATKEHKINATVDLVRPQVVETTFGDRDAKTLTVRFDKAVSAADKKYFTVKKGNDNVPVNTVSAADSSNKIFYVTFFNDLNGTYNLKVADVQDTTALKNTLVEYNGTFIANDNNSPSIQFVDYNESTRKVTLNFGREMDLSTLNNKANYYISFVKNGGSAQSIALPAEATVNAVNGGKSVVIQFPENIDATRVTFGPAGSVKSITAAGLKSKTGQIVSINTKPLDNADLNRLQWNGAVQKDARTFELEFNQVIANASNSDFRIAGQYPVSVSINENKVTLKTDRDYVGGNTNITVVSNNNIETYSNNRMNLAIDQTSPVNSNVSPKVTSVGTVVNGSVVAQRNALDEFFVTFTSNVAGVEAQIGNDFIVTNEATGKELTLNEGFKAEFADESNQVKITVLGATATDRQPVTVKVKKDAKYLKATGTNGPVVAESSTYTVVANPVANNNAVTGVATYNPATNATLAKVNENGLSFTAVPTKAGAVGNITVTLRVVPADPEVEKVSFSNDGTVITVDDTATAANIALAAQGKADLPYTVVAGDGTLPTDPTTTYELADGEDAKEATVTVQLSKAASGVVNRVAISNSEGTKNYAAELVMETGATTSQELVVKLGTDTVKANSTLSGKLIVNNEQVNLTTGTITIN
ncbi:S-layer homology domain-containing protein [Bacillales bacterium AN1005]